MTKPNLRAGLLALSLLAMPVLALPPAPAWARSAPESFADLADKLAPGVVNISTSQTLTAKDDRGPDMPQFPPGSPLDKFFRDFMERNHGGRDNAPHKAISLGSGFVIDPTGIVVTNNHVIDGADEITVTFPDGGTFKAKLLGHDERTDIAVLKIDGTKPFPFVSFGDSDKARVGDWVVAIGNPFGLGGSVTAGIVSARGRDINQGPYDNFIQTDAAINKGNSGGPLFNMDGEVIGINTAIYSPTGGSIGIGFSIPANLAKPVVDQLRNFGRARRGWLGVRIQGVSDDIAESVGLKEPAGAMIAGLNEGGPAEKAKLRNGDIVLKFNGAEVKDMRALPRLVADTAIGASVPIEVWRDGKSVTLTVTVGEMPDDAKVASAAPDKPAPAKSADLDALGLRLAAITPDAREKFQLPADQKGVLITDVVAGTAAAERGLKPGDVIVEVQQEEVATPADVAARVEKVKRAQRKSVLMLVQSGDGLHWVPLSLAPSEKKAG